MQVQREAELLLTIPRGIAAEIIGIYETTYVVCLIDTIIMTIVWY